MVVDTACQRQCVGTNSIRKHAQVLAELGLMIPSFPTEEGFAFGISSCASRVRHQLPSGIASVPCILQASEIHDNPDLPLLASQPFMLATGGILDTDRGHIHFPRLSAFNVRLFLAYGGHLAIPITEWPRQGFPRDADQWPESNHDIVINPNQPSSELRMIAVDPEGKEVDLCAFPNQLVFESVGQGEAERPEHVFHVSSLDQLPSLSSSCQFFDLTADEGSPVEEGPSVARAIVEVGAGDHPLDGIPCGHDDDDGQAVWTDGAGEASRPHSGQVWLGRLVQDGRQLIRGRRDQPPRSSHSGAVDRLPSVAGVPSLRPHSGVHSGDRFWGCPAYPQCTGTRRLQKAGDPDTRMRQRQQRCLHTNQGKSQIRNYGNRHGSYAQCHMCNLKWKWENITETTGEWREVPTGPSLRSSASSSRSAPSSPPPGSDSPSTTPASTTYSTTSRPSPAPKAKVRAKAKAQTTAASEPMQTFHYGSDHSDPEGALITDESFEFTDEEVMREEASA